MKDAEFIEREQMIDQALNAQTLIEIEAAAKCLQQWLQDHPDDLSAEDALEPLAVRRRALDRAHCALRELLQEYQ